VLAVLARHGGVQLGTSDVFVSVAGGVRVEEPGADLAVALAVASAARGVVADAGHADGEPRPLAAFGEIGLTGELRHVAHPDRRLAEAAKFGLGDVVHPAGAVRTLRAALAQAFDGAPARAAAA
jgi:DNA repair protein RadA/Sms